MQLLLQLLLETMILCSSTTTTFAFGVARRFASTPLSTFPGSAIRRRMASPIIVQASTKPTSGSSYQELYGIDFVQKTVVDVLNDIFDPKEVARGNALAKLGKGNKKKQKKPKKGGVLDDTTATTPTSAQEPVELELSDEEKNAIADAAAADSKPFGLSDAMVTPATRSEFGDYQVNAAMGLANAVGMNPR